MWGSGLLLFILALVLWLFFPFRGAFPLLHFCDRWVSSFPKFRFVFKTSHIQSDLSRHIAWSSSDRKMTEPIFPDKFLEMLDFIFSFCSSQVQKALVGGATHKWTMQNLHNCEEELLGISFIKAIPQIVVIWGCNASHGHRCYDMG